MTIPVDLALLGAQPGLQVNLARNVWLRDAGASEPYSGFASASKVDVAVQVAAVRGDDTPELTVTVQGSSNGGSDWTTVAGPWVFGRDGEESLQVVSPPDLLRVAWSVAGGLQEAVIGMVSVVPITVSGGGSGGSQPVPTLRGPYVIAFDTPADVSSSGARQYQRLAALAVGEILYDVLHFVDVAWAGPDADSLVMFTGVYDDYFGTPIGGSIDNVKQFKNDGPNSRGPMYGPTPQDWHHEATAGYGNFTVGLGTDKGPNPVNPMLIATSDLLDPFEVSYFAVEIDWSGADPSAGQSTFYTLVIPAT